MTPRKQCLENIALLAIVAVVAVLCALLTCAIAHGQSKSAATGLPQQAAGSDQSARGMAESAALQLARVCSFEADRREADCSAIYFVAVKRAIAAHTDWLTMLRRYSTLDRTHTPRASRVKREQPPAELVALAERLIRGEVQDPCMSATHWGGRGDSPRGRMVRAQCSQKTVNTFYKVKQ